MNSNLYRQEIIKYYDTCWVHRFKEGHNPKSLAMHMGYFEPAAMDNDDAKANMNRFLANNLNLQENHGKLFIVDAGCGVGGTCLFLSNYYTGLNITGINISRRQIDLARTFMTANSKSKSEVNFVCEDFCNSSLPVAYADVVFAIESICHAEEKRDFFDEAYRILKPGGLLVILDYVQTPASIGDKSGELIKTFQKGWAVKEYISAPAEGLELAGFNDVSVQSIRHKVMPGIIKSYEGALKKISALNGSIPGIMRKHLNACIALKKLSETNVIDYCLIKASK